MPASIVGALRTTGMYTIGGIALCIIGGCTARVAPEPGPSAQTVEVAKKSSALATGYWNLQGNSGTAAGGNFLGTTDNQAVEVKVNSVRALRIEPNFTTPNLIGGYSGNQVTDGAVGSTIAGGGESTSPNIISDQFCFIGGGLNNVAGDQDGNSQSVIGATIGGGTSNTASASGATIAGGSVNTAGSHDTIGGGMNNTAQGTYATIAGGAHNTTASGSLGSSILGGQGNNTSGNYSTVLGGYANEANGDFSLVAGNQARSNRPGCFVWADSTRTSSTSCWLDNQWLSIATGGTFIYTDTGGSTGVYVPSGSGTWYSASSRDLKQNIRPVDAKGVLKKVSEMPISSWSYKTDPGVRHIGPMAQDFYSEFQVGGDDKSIAVVDADGVALAAIKALNTQVQALQQENQSLKARLDAIEAKLGTKP